MKKKLKNSPILFIYLAVFFLGGCVSEIPADPPEIKTYDPATSITSNSASILGYDDSGGDVTEVGICWNTAGNPTRNDSKVICRILKYSGLIFGDLTNLKSHTKYVARAYEVHGKNVYYGNVVSFRTAFDITVNVSESSITSASVTFTGKSVDIGKIKEVGISWSNGNYPASPYSSTLSVPYTKLVCNVNADGTFSGTLSGLDPNKQYNLMPYLINEEATFYGNVAVFTTKN
jgi:hypothetical protein